MKDQLSDEDINQLASYMETYFAPRDCVIFHEHSEDSTIGLLIDGTINIVKEDNDSQSKVLAKLGKGQFFGEMAFIDGQPRSASICAENDSTVLLMSKKTFDKMIVANPKLANKLLFELARMMSLRLRSTSETLVPFLKTAQNKNE